jgi:hypothetical protein
MNLYQIIDLIIEAGKVLTSVLVILTLACLLGAVVISLTL